MERTELLSEGLSRLGIPFDENHILKLCLFLEEIELWNSDSRRNKKGLSLVRAEKEDLVVRHILDCLAGLPVIRRFSHNRIADIGSGAGFPGIPFAIFLPETTIALVERSGRKAAFLRNTAACLRLTNVEIQDVPLKQATGKYDVVMFRALKRIETILDDALAITAPGGVVAAYKGKSLEVNDEIASLTSYAVEMQPLDVPFLEEERNLVLIRVIEAS